MGLPGFLAKLKIKKKKPRKKKINCVKPKPKTHKNSKGSKRGRETEIMAVLSVLLHFVISKKHLSASSVATSLVL